MNHRETIQVLDAGAERDVLEEVGNHAHVGHGSRDVLQYRQHGAVRFQGQGEEDGVDALVFDDARGLVSGSDDRHAPIGNSSLRGIVVDEGDGSQTRLRVVGELVDQRPAQASGPDHENAAYPVSVPPRLLEVAANRGPPGEHEEHVGREKEDEHRSGVVEAAREGRDADQEQGRQCGRHEDGETFLDARAAPADLVQAVEVIDEGPDDRDVRVQPEVGGCRGHPLGDRDDLGVEAEPVRGGERHEARDQVGGEEERREAAVRVLDHVDGFCALPSPGVPAPATSATSATALANSRANRSRANGRAAARTAV